MLQVVWDTAKVNSALTVSLLCRLMLFFNGISALGNFYSYLLITIDRYFYIELPMRYISIITHKRAILGAVVIWVVNLVQTTSMIKWEKLLEIPQHSCIWVNDNLTHQAGLFISFFEGFFVVCFVLVPIYGRIVYTTCQLIHNDPHLSHFAPEGQAQQMRKIQERKLTKTIGWVFGVYVITYYPLLIYYAIVSQIYGLPFPFWILLGNKIAILVHKLQNVLNPLIYGTKNRMMKTAFQKMLCKNSVVPANPEVHRY